MVIVQNKWSLLWPEIRVCDFKMKCAQSANWIWSHEFYFRPISKAYMEKELNQPRFQKRTKKPHFQETNYCNQPYMENELINHLWKTNNHTWKTEVKMIFLFIRMRTLRQQNELVYIVRLLKYKCWVSYLRFYKLI